MTRAGLALQAVGIVVLVVSLAAAVITTGQHPFGVLALIGGGAVLSLGGAVLVRVGDWWEHRR